MTAPRQPRQWVEGDPEPTDVYEVQHTNSQRYRRTFVTVNYGGSVVVRFWAWQSGPSGALLSWDTLAGRLGGYKLTEVLTDDEVPGVLPETPEPVSMPVLPTYETYFHGEKLVQCGGCGKQVLQVLHSCKGIPAPQSSPAPLLPLSAPVETEGEVEGRTEALRADAIESASESVHDQWMATKRGQGVASRLSESGEELMVPYAELSEAAKDLDRGSVAVTVDALLDMGWGPPVAVCVVEEEARDQLIEALNAAVDQAVDRDDRDQCDIIADDLLELGWSKPSNDWEWGCGVGADDLGLFDEKTAREQATLTGTLRKRRAAGPWVAVPVEPKETK